MLKHIHENDTFRWSLKKAYTDKKNTCQFQPELWKLLQVPCVVVTTTKVEQNHKWAEVHFQRKRQLDVFTPLLYSTQH